MRRTKANNYKLLPSYCGSQQAQRITSLPTSSSVGSIAGEDHDYEVHSPSSSRLFSRQYHKPAIKPFERDLLHVNGNSTIHVFRPYVNLIAPLFVKTVLDNEQLMKRLHDLDKQVIQRIIQHIYQEASLEFECDNMDCLCRFMFMLQSCDGELVEVKRNLLHNFQQKVTVSNVLDVIESIDNWQSLNGPPEQQESNLLDAVKSYCFSFIRKHVCEEEFDFKLNSRVEKYIYHFYNKKEQDFIEWYEKPNEISSSNVFEELFNEGEALDYDFTIDFGDGVFIRANKTILASNSLFFESMFSSSSSFIDVDKSVFYPDTSINASALYCIIEYCYGILNPSHINQNNIIALIQMAHEHDIPSLMEHCIPLLRQHIRLSNTLEMFQFCEQVFEYESFQPFTNMIISFGSLHAKSIFHTHSKQSLSLTPLTLSAIFELYLKK